MTESVSTWTTGQTYSFNFYMNTYLQSPEFTSELYAIDDINNPLVESGRIIINEYTSNKKDFIFPQGSFSNVTKVLNKFTHTYSHDSIVFSELDKAEITVRILN